MSGKQLGLQFGPGITLDELTELQSAAPWPDDGRMVPAESQVRERPEVSRATYQNILRARTVREVSAAFRGERISPRREEVPTERKQA